MDRKRVNIIIDANLHKKATLAANKERAKRIKESGTKERYSLSHLIQDAVLYYIKTFLKS